MALTEHPAQGTLIQYGDGGSPEKFTTVAHVREIGGPAVANPTIDCTDLADVARQRISSALVDGAEITLSVFADLDADTPVHDTLIDKAVAGTQNNWSICWPILTTADGARTGTFDTIGTGSDQIDMAAAHLLHTGQPVRLTTTGALPSPLAINTTYYAIYVDADSIKLATTNANAVAGTAIDLTTTGSGTNKFVAGGVFTFAARVVSAEPAAARGEALLGTLTLAISGTVTPE